jgi:hypothetical protein
MSVRFIRPVSRSAFLSRYFGLISLALMVLTFVLHRIGMLSTPDFLASQMVSIAFAVGALLLAILGLRQLWLHGARGGIAAMHTLLLIALPLMILGVITYRHFDRPAFYDVSSDIVDLPEWLEPPAIDQKWLVRSETLSAQEREAQRSFYPEFASHRYDGAVDRVYTAARKVAKSKKITLTAIAGFPGAEPDRAIAKQQEAPLPEDDGFEFTADELPVNVPVPSFRPQSSLQAALPTSQAVPEDTVTLQGYMISKMLGLPYNLVIRLREDGETTLVDIRVMADYGSNDYGLGVLIAKDYLAALDAEMQGLNDQ